MGYLSSIRRSTAHRLLSDGIGEPEAAAAAVEAGDPAASVNLDTTRFSIHARCSSVKEGISMELGLRSAILGYQTFFSVEVLG